MHNVLKNLIYRMHINYRRILQNHIFTNTEQKYMMLLPSERGMFCSFIVTLNEFDVRPSCDKADVQAILPFPQNLLKHILCDVPDCGVDALSSFWLCLWKLWDLNIILDETPQEEITHLSGLVTVVARCRMCCLCPLHDQPIELAGIHLKSL